MVSEIKKITNEEELKYLWKRNKFWLVYLLGILLPKVQSEIKPNGQLRCFLKLTISGSPNRPEPVGLKI